MNIRNVKSSGRQTYGRVQPLSRPRKRAIRRPAVGATQRRLIILAIVVLAGAWGLSRLFAITTITVNSTVRQAAVKVEVSKLVGEGWMQGNLITLNSGDLVSKLQQEDPLLRSVVVRRNWFHAITVIVTLKQPSIGWSTGNQKYLLDRDGTAIGVLSVGSKLPVVTDGSNLPVEIGQRVAPSRFTDFVTTLDSALAANKITPTGYSVKDTTLDLNVATNKGYGLVFDTGRGVDEEMADLKSVLALLAAQKKTPAEYIDLRVSGKAYYK